MKSFVFINQKDENKYIDIWNIMQYCCIFASKNVYKCGYEDKKSTIRNSQNAHLKS